MKKRKGILSTVVEVKVNMSQKTQWKGGTMINTEKCVSYKLVFDSTDESL